MTWHRLPEPLEIDSVFKKRCHFLIDRCLGREIADYMKTKKYNVKFVDDVGLSERSDEDLLAYAWREQRILLTHDRGFLDDRRFPEHRNPGVIVLPGGAGDNEAMAAGVFIALRFFGCGPSFWTKTKAVVSATGEVTIRFRDFDTGRIGTKRYRLARGGVDEWRD
jgi:predicted nuclease of predicted toxin-antitoxin system